VKLGKLDVTAFGRFQGYRLELRDGLNVIYGYNESGKSTLAAFIKAVFFGFKKAHTRNRSYQPEYDKYVPWSGHDFCGAIEYEVAGNIFRVERVFDRKREELKVYRLDTGEDITRSFPYDANKREYVFAGQHLGLHEKVFSNSVFLEQGAFAVDSLEAAPFIREKLINLMMTGDEEISLKRALQAIEQSCEEIGTARSQKKPLGVATARLDSLQQELSGIEKQLKNLRAKEAELAALREQLAIIRDEIDLLKRSHLYLEASEHFEAYVESGRKLDLHKPDELARELRETREAFEHCRAHTQELRGNIEELDKQIKVDNPEFWMEKIDNLRETIQNIVRESSTLESRGEEKIQAAEGKRKRATVFLTGSLSALAAFFVLLYLNAGLWLAALAILLSAGLASLAWKNHGAYQAFTHSRNETDVRRNVNRLLLAEKQNLLNDILGQLGATDIDQGKKYLQQAVRLKNRKREIQTEIEIIQKDLMTLESKMALLEERMVQVQDIKTERQREQAILQSLGFKDVDKCVNEFFEIRRRLTREAGDVSVNRDIGAEIEKLSQQYEETLTAIGRLEQQLNDQPVLLGKYTDLQAEALFWQARRDELTANLEALVLARQGIEAAVSGYQQDYLSKLNHRAREIVDKLFAGRYHTVNLNENLEIMTVAPGVMKMISVDRTSQGTMELFYLALRLALSEMLSRGPGGIFLVLDEPFANLDMPRLQRLIDFLEIVAREKQVIVFTCREEVLNLLPPGTHLVSLEQSA